MIDDLTEHLIARPNSSSSPLLSGRKPLPPQKQLVPTGPRSDRFAAPPSAGPSSSSRRTNGVGSSANAVPVPSGPRSSITPSSSSASSTPVGPRADNKWAAQPKGNGPTWASTSVGAGGRPATTTTTSRTRCVFLRSLQEINRSSHDTDEPSFSSHLSSVQSATETHPLTPLQHPPDLVPPFPLHPILIVGLLHPQQQRQLLLPPQQLQLDVLPFLRPMRSLLDLVQQRRRTRIRIRQSWRLKKLIRKLGEVRKVWVGRVGRGVEMIGARTIGGIAEGELPSTFLRP